MISLWSALNPGVWVSNGDSEFGTFTLRPEVPVNINTRKFRYFYSPLEIS